MLHPLISLFKQYKSEKIYDKNGFEKILLIPFLDFLNFENKLLDTNELSIFSQYINSKDAKKISFITLNKSDYALTGILKDFLLKDQKENIEINLVNPYQNINQCLNSDLKIFFGSLESTKYSEITDLKNKCKILNINLEGFFLFKKIN